MKERRPHHLIHQPDLGLDHFLHQEKSFLKGALFIENDSEAIITDNLFFNTNLKYSIYNNFDDFRYEPG